MTKQDQITLVLRDEIRQGKYPVSSKLPSEQELSDRFAASTITVNKAVGILVQQGYLERSESSRGGTRVKNPTPFPDGNIYFLTELKINFCAEIVSGAVKQAALRNYALCLLMPMVGELTETLKKLRDSGCKGLLTNCYGLLPEQPFPVVYLDAMVKEEEFFVVRCNSYQGGRQLVEALWKAGHREMIYFSDFPGIRQTERMQGFIDYLTEKGIKDIERRIFVARNNTAHAAQDELRKISKIHPGCTAIVCSTDFEAFNLIQGAVRLGFDLQERYAVTGFGNVKEVQMLYPIPTVEQHPFEIGMRGCEKLIEIIQYGEEHTEHVEVLGVEILNERMIHPPRA